MFDILDDNASGAKKILTVDSDLINGHLTGDYSFETLHNSFLKILGKHLPSLSQEAIPESRNNFVFDIEIRDSEILGEFVELPFGISERSNIGGSCNDERELLNVNGSLNGIDINKKSFDNITIESISNTVPDRTTYLANGVDTTKNSKFYFSFFCRSPRPHCWRPPHLCSCKKPLF